MRSLKFLLPIAIIAAALNLSAEPLPEDCRQGGFVIGCQAWTFKDFTVFEAIERTARAGGKIIEMYPGQKFDKDGTKKWDHDAGDDMIAQVKAKLAEHKVRAVNYGVVSIPADEAEARKIFEFAKKMGLYAITTESEKSIETIEKLVKEFDICVAFHNHPKTPDHPNYLMWDPRYVFKLIEKRDMRVGASGDTGHWSRSGLNPVECLQILRGRLISLHLKDLNETGKPDAHDMPYGTGAVGIPDIMNELKDQAFTGHISVEYEHNWQDSVTDVASCIGYVRGYGQSKSW